MVAFAGRTLQAPPEILERMPQIKGNSLNFKIDERKGLDVHGYRQTGYRGSGFEVGRGTLPVCWDHSRFRLVGQLAPGLRERGVRKADGFGFERVSTAGKCRAEARVR
jgi:hypothetical protein